VIRAVAGRELRSLFVSVLAWVVLGVVLFILAWIFLLQVDAFLRVAPRLLLYPRAPGVTALVAVPLVRSAASFLMFLLVPLVSMRAFADEYRLKTLPLLLSAPVRITDIVLGKYFGVLGFLLVLVLLVFAMPVSLALGTSPDWGLLAAAFVGLVLFVAALTAAGVYFSSLVRQPLAGAVATFGFFLFLSLTPWAARGHGPGSAVLRYLSPMGHLASFLRGEIRVEDVAYDLLFAVFFLTLTVRHLDAERLEH
jgi:ABC-2 type transport system permease protein